MTDPMGTHEKILNNNSGMALLVTLAVISVLLVMALELARITGESVLANGRASDEFLAEEMALSGIHLAMAILADDAAENGIDSVQEEWNDPEKISLAVGQLGFPRDSLSLKITDELGKIQVNALLKRFPGQEMNPDQRMIWENFLNLRISADKSEDQRDPAVIINALKDWLDSLDDDAVTGVSGAESDYYLQLESPYACTNGPFNHVFELLNVKGITPDLMGTGLDTNDPDSVTEPGGVEDIFTVYGLADGPSTAKTYYFPGKININTAGIEVLAALLPQGMEDLAREMVAFRKIKSEEGLFINLLDKGWYEQVIEFSEKEKKTFNRMIRYDSTFFKAEGMAVAGDARVVVTAFIKREQDKKTNLWACRIIQLTKE